MENTIRSKLNIPVMYFIGVSTQNSFINKLFPEWIKILNSDLILKGINLELNAGPSRYRDLITEIKRDNNIVGAVVTTHKMSIFEYASDLFDTLESNAKTFKEIATIFKRQSKLYGEAIDIISLNKEIEYISSQGKPIYEIENSMIIGCGGAGLSLAYNLLTNPNFINLQKIIITDIDNKRIENAKALLESYDTLKKLSFNLITNNLIHDKIISELKGKCLIANASGLGKDRVGTPISSACILPNFSIIWDFNYRGELPFLHNANKQIKDRNLIVMDGWSYFLHGWLTALEYVLNIKIEKELFHKLIDVANSTRQ